MASLDRVAKLITTKAQAMEIEAGGSATTGPDLVQQDVFAALGFGALRLPAYMIGLARYTGDQFAIDTALSIAVAAAYAKFEDNHWSAARAYQAPINKLVKAGELTPEEATYKKRQLAFSLPAKMASMAIDSLVGNDRCKPCNGTGFVTAKPCALCKTTGKRKRDESTRAHQCEIQYNAWHKTWRHRYMEIENEYRSWMNEFENHVTDKCR